MAKSTRQDVFEGLEKLQEGLQPFVVRSLNAVFDREWPHEVLTRFPEWKRDNVGKLDTQRLLKVMERFWRDVFQGFLSRTHRALVNELMEVRNKLAHNESFTYDDASRALDSMKRLLEAVSAGKSADDVGRMRDAVLRVKFTELQRNEERRLGQQLDFGFEPGSGLKSWREVVEPHRDVAEGNFQQAEFAADLAKVHSGSAPQEYRDPREFYARTFLTHGLSNLVVDALRRLSGTGGNPVVELQTNFGGGKTHSLLALYHATGAVPPHELPGLDQLLSEKGLTAPSDVNRAVLVGTSRGPQDQLAVEGGPRIRTTWGELAWQLGGVETYTMLADMDERGIAPGSSLLEAILSACAPSLILVDEWVAYLRQIYKVEGLPSGSFDANLSFVQSLTEAVKASPRTLLVASLPASQIEVGGEGGQEALTRLKQTFGRLGSAWRPASQDESYEIVRRRLFRDIPGDRFKHRDNTVKQFSKLYRENSDYFPRHCSEADYRRRLQATYPIHPELFDKLYTSWGSLEKFQRTRGVLRLMAQVIHELWMRNDPSLMIMPGNVAVNSERVEPELLHYLDASWQSIIAGDVEGAASTPYDIDRSVPNLSRHSAARRVARTIFLASAPLDGQENAGVRDKEINLGVVQPSERPPVFGDALRRLANQAKFLHSDQGRYWYSTVASLNRVAADRAAEVEETLVLTELDKSLRGYIAGLGDRGHFGAVQTAPDSSADIPDESGGVRLVVLGVAHSHSRGSEDSAATSQVEQALKYRGKALRKFRNTLVFLAADARALDDLKDAMRSVKAWESIVADIETGRLDLKSSDIAFAKGKASESRDTLSTRLRDAWCYLISPYKTTPEDRDTLSVSRIAPRDGVLASANKKLVAEEALLPEIGPQRLHAALQDYIWHDRPHLHLKEIWEHLNQFTYLPRLKNVDTLVRAVKESLSHFVPGPFAYAERWQDQPPAYPGLVIEARPDALVTVDSHCVLVRADVAEANRSVPAPPRKLDKPQVNDRPLERSPPAPTRFIGTVELSADRPNRDMGQIVEYIVDQLAAAPGARVSLRLEIDAKVPSGLDRNKVRALMENATTLGFEEKLIE